MKKAWDIEPHADVFLFIFYVLMADESGGLHRIFQAPYKLP